HIANIAKAHGLDPETTTIHDLHHIGLQNLAKSIEPAKIRLLPAPDSNYTSITVEVTLPVSPEEISLAVAKDNGPGFPNGIELLQKRILGQLCSLLAVHFAQAGWADVKIVDGIASLKMSVLRPSVE